MKNTKTASRLCRVVVLLAVTGGADAQAQAQPESPLQKHMQRMLNHDDQWRTPNPGYDADNAAPEAFGLKWYLAPDGSHVTGHLTGIHADGREALYWTLLVLYNPVTRKVVTQQIGWDGTLLFGEVDVQPGPVQLIEMMHYPATGKVSISRHENRFAGTDTHLSLVLEPDDQGEWKQTQSWEWTRHRSTGEAVSAFPAAAAEKISAGLAEHAGFLLAGSGQWRAPNPAYEAGSETEQFYGMNYRPGPHGQHIVGEIVSIFDDGRQTRDWTLYLTYNPITRKAWLEQTGAGGVYFRGELRKTPHGRHSQTGVVYLPNGQARAVRDEIEIIDDKTYRAHVFEGAPAGGWTKVREWTWTLQQPDEPAD